MALASPEVVSIRRHAGYPALGTSTVADVVETRLAVLTNDEEVVLLDLYLPALDKLEAAIPASGDLLDTKQAAVWHRNLNELAERFGLYRSQRLALCAFLGIDPGPGIPPAAEVIGPGGVVVAPWLPPEVFVV